MMIPTLARRGATALGLLALGACSSTGGLGNVLGSVLGGQNQNQLSGVVAGVDTRRQQIGVQQSNGQTIAVSYDNQTQVVFQNRNYPITSLERGDQVTARLQNSNGGGYYTDLVQVDQPAQGSASNGATSGSVQQLQGTVRQIDQQNGLFTMDVGNGSRITVSMPYSPNRQDVNRFQNLRSGDYVRIAGVFMNNSRVELRQFY